MLLDNKRQDRAIGLIRGRAQPVLGWQNFSETFIPAAHRDSLLNAGLCAMFCVIAIPQPASVSVSQRLTFPRIIRFGRIAWARRVYDGLLGSDVLERQFTTISGIDSMISNSSQGSTKTSHYFRLRAQLDWRSGGSSRLPIARRPCPCCRRACRSPPSPRSQNPWRSAHILLDRVRIERHDASDLDEYAEMMIRFTALHGGWRSAGECLRRGEIRRARADGSQASWLPRSIGLNEVQAGNPEVERESSERNSVRPHTAYIHSANGQLMKAADYGR